ncbi:MAG TPA: type 4a pilus biogenesis protein PilO [Elusimicrobiota bacterium]|nr:type 4a pilus biogenesis protein PilO [Elusimicrobiota bacterium]
MALSKQQQQQIALIVMLGGGFLFVYWNYLLKPTNAKIVALETQVTDILGQVETMKRTANRLPALQREYDALVAEVGETEKRLPKEKNLQEVLRIVTEQSMKNKISVLSFAPGGDVQQNYCVEIPISLNITGQFHTLGKFLAILGQQERILTARDVRLSYTPNEKKGHTISGSFILLAYTFKG